MELKWTADEVFGFLETEFPHALQRGLDYEVVSLAPEALDLRATADERHLRPGGTISGPTMMELVDCAIYVLLLAHHREEARLAVTTNLAISFLRKPKPGMKWVISADRRRRHGCRPSRLSHRRHPPARQAQSHLHPAC
jgi:acyl-coenzyme A thioesterase PaaI-like protein